MNIIRSMVLTGTLLSAFSALAELIPSTVETQELRLQYTQSGKLLISGGYSYLYGYSLGVETGLVYFSCYPGRVDTFRLNFVLDTVMPDHFASTQFFVGPRKNGEMGLGLLGSKVTDQLAEPPSEFSLKAFAQGFPAVVRPFDEFDVSDSKKLYIQSFPDARFLEELKRSDRLAVIAYNSNDRRYDVVMELNYLLKDETVKKLLVSCLDLGG